MQEAWLRAYSKDPELEAIVVDEVAEGSDRELTGRGRWMARRRLCWLSVEPLS